MYCPDEQHPLIGLSLNETDKTLATALGGQHVLHAIGNGRGFIPQLHRYK
ncbi:hypothetical protein VCRA2110O2_30267 [Vibrio crassostreae]|nr:hypothetical protein VCHA44O286_50109 [Vibrio chagasii]CAK2867593.1 hypothetical protein VCRA2110O2_30267 [Vibrio crassostreae]